MTLAVSDHLFNCRLIISNKTQRHFKLLQIIVEISNTEKHNNFDVLLLQIVDLWIPHIFIENLMFVCQIIHVSNQMTHVFQPEHLRILDICRVDLSQRCQK